MKRKILFFFTIVVMFTMIPNVLAAENYGTVKDITEQAGNSLTSGKGTLTTKGDTTTIKYSVATFKMLEADREAADGERPGPAAWIGFEITEPDDDKDSKFKVTTPDNKTTEIKAPSYKDYVGITPDNLKNALLKGTMLTYKYSFDWNEDGSNQQYVIIEIDPEGISLLSTDGRDTVWSPDIAQKILKEQNPNTADINLLAVFGLIAVSCCGLIYYFKRA